MKKLFLSVVALMAVISINAYDAVYIVGDSSPAGWSTDDGNLAKTTMTKVSTDVFEWTGVLTKTSATGEGFKLLTEKNWNPAMHPSEAGLMLNEKGSDVVRLPYSGDPDTKWKISETAEYTLRVTFRTENVLVELEKVAEVGVDIPEKDGVYQLSTAEHLKTFAEKLNEGIIAGNCSAVLTQDIDLSSIEKWATIGTDAKRFVGTFNGQYHRIKGMSIDGSKKEQGFFGVAGAGAVIKNLIMDASCSIVSTGGGCLAALIGCCNGDGTITIENCGNEANITGKGANNAAFLGCNYGATKIVFNNCYNTGKISGGNENGAFSGWCGGGATFNNCWNTGEVTEGETWARGSKTISNCYQTVGSDEGVTKVTAEQVANGELCYKLNGDQSSIKWYQNLTGTVDATPVFFPEGHSQVYANGTLKCDGTSAGGDLTYSNSSTSVIPPHTIKEGLFCEVCGSVRSDWQSWMTAESDGSFAISTAEQLYWFSLHVNDGNSANARLTADIDFASIKDYVPIGTEDKRYTGAFDGQGHQIKNLAIELNQDNVGVFGVVAQGTVIKNFTLASSSSIKGNGHVGIVGMIKRNADGEVRLECLGNEAKITGKGNNVGGILGVNMYSSGYAKLYMTNCYTTGDIAGSGENGQLTGWSGDNAVLENCYAIGNMTNCDGFARLGSGSSVTNSYCDKDLTWNGHPTLVSAEQVESGELAYMLNGKNGGTVFYQDAGTGHPVFDPAAGQVFSISDAGYSTAVFSKNVVAPANTVFTATVDGDVVKTAAVDADATVAAGTAVILAGEKSSFISLKPSTAAPATLGTNVLKGSATEDYEVANEGDIYILAKNDANEAVFAPAQVGTLKAGKAYFEKASVASGAPVLRIGGTTGIANTIAMPDTNEYYDLTGRRVNQLQQGIYIVNGKKVVVK